MAQTVDIDLNSEKDVAELAADLQPGDSVVIRASVKAKNEQTLTVTINMVEVDGESAETDGDLQDEDEGNPEKKNPGAY